jgi:rhodanese-related sulfurtransferase
MIKEINSTELNQRLDSDSDIFLLDIRSANELAQGVLPQSQHVPMHLLPLRMNDFPKDKDVVLYCHSGARSAHACMYLMQQGFTNVINLHGGILDWARNGLQIVTPAYDAAI